MKALGQNAKRTPLFKNPLAIGKSEPPELENFFARVALEINGQRNSLFRRWMMTQSQVSTHLSDKVGITKKQAKSALEELTSLVVRELKREGSLRLAGLGIFRQRKTQPRMGRNPPTGPATNHPARPR